MGFSTLLQKPNNPQGIWPQTELPSSPYPGPTLTVHIPDIFQSNPSPVLPKAARACGIMQRPCWGRWCSSPREHSHRQTLPPRPHSSRGTAQPPDPPHQHRAPLYPSLSSQPKSKAKKERRERREERNKKLKQMKTKTKSSSWEAALLGQLSKIKFRFIVGQHCFTHTSNRPKKRKNKNKQQLHRQKKKKRKPFYLWPCHLIQTTIYGTAKVHTQKKLLECSE